MSENLQFAPHPDADQLNAFCENVLPVQEREQMMAHLALCARCREVVSIVMPAAEEPLAAVQTVPGAGWFRGWRMAWVGVAACALLVGIGLPLMRKPLVKAPQAVDTVAEARPAAPLRVPVPVPAPAPVFVPAPMPPKDLARARSASAQATPLPATPVVPGAEMQKPGAQPSPVTELPLESRRVAILPLRPGEPPPLDRSLSDANGAVVGALAGMGAGRAATTAGKVPAQPAGVADTVSVDASNAQVETMNAASTQLVMANLRLPGGQAVRSSVTRGRQVLAIDAAGTLFRSGDGGMRWVVVQAVWGGHAVRVAQAGEAENGFAPPRARAMAQQAAAAPAAPAVAAAAPAPAGPGTLAGRVTDASGAVIPGAAVSMTHLADGVVRAARATTQGDYRFNGLAPGSYRVQVDSPGFMSLRTQVDVMADKPTGKDVQLAVGSMSEAVTVTAAQPEGSVVQKKKGAPAPTFEMTTDLGERWTSVDGQNWQKAQAK